MKFDFGQIYPEVDTYYNLASELLYLLCDQLNPLNKNIKHYDKLFEGNDYSIVFIISATRKKDVLEVKGPILLKKRKEVEFALHIPYKKFSDCYEETSYVLKNICQGIIFVLNKYKADPSGIEETFDKVINTVKASTGQFYREW